MTGGQTHAGTPGTLSGAETRPVDLPAIVTALGVEYVDIVDPYDYKACLAALKKALAFEGPAVIITNRPCMLFPRKIAGDRHYEVDTDLCTACQQCMKLGCPSLRHVEVTHRNRRKVEIDVETCTGCSLCSQLCAAGGDHEGGCTRERPEDWCERHPARRRALCRRHGRRHHGRRRRRPGRDRGRRHHRRDGLASRRPRREAERDAWHVATRRQRALSHPHRPSASMAPSISPGRGRLPACLRGRPRGCAWLRRGRRTAWRSSIRNRSCRRWPRRASSRTRSTPSSAWSDGRCGVIAVDGNAVAEASAPQGRRRRAGGRAVCLPDFAVGTWERAIPRTCRRDGAR